MDDTRDAFYKEAQTMVQNLNQNLVTLATSLRGRLSPAEEDLVANLFQAQLNLQALLDAMPARLTPVFSEALTAAENREADRIAYAQALEYARDLVKAMRQKKENQRRLELTSQQLIRAEKLATVGRVAATVAHEMGNILTPLLMYAKLIYEETADQEGSDAAEFAVQITQIANRASQMLRQLVDASRAESTMIVPVDLPRTIQNTLTLLAPQLNDHGLKVEQHYPENLPVVLGRPDQLEQVFINIIRNAFDAMPDGGSLSVTVEAGYVQILGADGPDYAAVRFTDTGVGIPPDHIGSLFEPFFTTKARGAGSGLGLFVSYLIVNQHGGTIEVESEPGVGTTFTILLPTADNEEGEANTWRL